MLRHLYQHAAVRGSSCLSMSVSPPSSELGWRSKIIMAIPATLAPFGGCGWVSMGPGVQSNDTAQLGLQLGLGENKRSHLSITRRWIGLTLWRSPNSRMLVQMTQPMARARASVGSQPRHYEDPDAKCFSMPISIYCYGKKWKNGTGKQYFTDITGLLSTTVT